MSSATSELPKIHVWIARLGVLAIAVIAFLFVYDAGVTWGSAVGWRTGLAKLWPWLIEGFMALVVYAGWVIKSRNGSLRYPASLFFALLAVSGYINFRVHTHPRNVHLAVWETGSSATLPVLILAGAVHLLLKTFENPITEVVAKPEAIALSTTSAPVNLIDAEAEREPVELPEIESFSGDELKALPEPDSAPQLRGQANLRRLAASATDPKVREIWRDIAGMSD